MIINRSVLHTLTIFHSVKQNHPPLEEMGDSLVLTQEQTQHDIILNLSSQLNIVQNVRATIKGGYLSHNLAFTQHIGVGKSYARAIGHTISFSSLGKRIRLASVSSALTLNQYVNRPYVQSSLVLVQTVAGSSAHDIKHTIGLNQVVSTKLVRVRSVSSTLDIGSTVTEWINNPNVIRIAVTPPSQPQQIELVMGSLSVLLPNAEFGNTEKYEQTRILRRNRGGELNVYRDGMWPATTTISYSFTWMTQEQTSQLLDFMRKSLGKAIRLIDHEGVGRDVVILTPSKDIAQNGICNFALNGLEFQEL